MRLGLLLRGAGMSPKDLAAWALSAERVGFDGVWVPEALRDVIVPLTLVANATSSVRIGSACALVGRPPHLTVLAASGIDELSNGRLVLGIADGPSGPNASWYGPAVEKPVQRMHEYVDLIRLMLAAHSGPPLDFDGEYYKVKAYQRRLAPLRDDIPIYIGATRPTMIRLAGRIANGYVAPALNSPKFFDEAAIPNIEAGLAATGRVREEFEVVSLRICAIHADAQEARRRVKPHLTHYAGIAPALAEVFDLHGFAIERRELREAFLRGDFDSAVAALPDEAIDVLSVVGTPEDVRRQLAEYENRADTVILEPPSHLLTPKEVIENHQAILDTFGGSR